MELFIVTGTTRGIGKALAAAIAERSDAALIEISRAPATNAPGRWVLTTDLADPAQVDLVWDRVRQCLGAQRFTRATLINNAAVLATVGPLPDVPGDELARSLQVNLIAPIRLMQGFAKAGTGWAERLIIANISSGAGRRPIPGWAAYCTAKAGLDMAGRALALEATEHHWPLSVYSVAPGIIDTDMQAQIRESTPEQFSAVSQFRRYKAEGALLAPDFVAAKLLRLLDAGKFRHGEIDDLREFD